MVDGRRTPKNVETTPALNLGSNSGAETIHLTINSLAEVLLQPSFKLEDTERTRNVLLTGLLQKKASLAAVANDQAIRLFYGPKHPLGNPEVAPPIPSTRSPWPT